MSFDDIPVAFQINMKIFGFAQKNKLFPEKSIILLAKQQVRLVDFSGKFVKESREMFIRLLENEKENINNPKKNSRFFIYFRMLIKIEMVLIFYRKESDEILNYIFCILEEKTFNQTLIETILPFFKKLALNSLSNKQFEKIKNFINSNLDYNENCKYIYLILSQNFEVFEQCNYQNFLEFNQNVLPFNLINQNLEDLTFIFLKIMNIEDRSQIFSKLEKSLQDIILTKNFGNKIIDFFYLMLFLFQSMVKFSQKSFKIFLENISIF